MEPRPFPHSDRLPIVLGKVWTLTHVLVTWLPPFLATASGFMSMAHSETARGVQFPRSQQKQAIGQTDPSRRLSSAE